MMTKAQYNNMLELMGKMDDRKLAEHIGVNQRQVAYHRRKCNVPAHCRWSEKRVNELVNYYLLHSIAECAEHFGMTIGSIRVQMSKLRKQGYGIPYEI